MNAKEKQRLSIGIHLCSIIISVCMYPCMYHETAQDHKAMVHVSCWCGNSTQFRLKLIVLVYCCPCDEESYGTQAKETCYPVTKS